MTSPQLSGLSLAKRRVDDNETRQRMLQVAADFIRQEGLTVSLDHLSYELIIQTAAVPRSAAYRLWKKKEDFFADLLQEIAAHRWEIAALDKSAVRSVLEAALEYQEQLDTHEGRKHALLNAVRVGLQLEFQRITESTDWQTYVALSATIMSLPAGDLKNSLLQELEESEAEQMGRATRFYQPLANLLGFRVKAEFGGDFLVLASVIEAIIEGFALRSLGTPHIRNHQYIFESSPLGREVDWSLPALTCVSAIEPMIEEDPDYNQMPVLTSIVRKIVEEYRE